MRLCLASYRVCLGLNDNTMTPLKIFAIIINSHDINQLPHQINKTHLLVVRHTSHYGCKVGHTDCGGSHGSRFCYSLPNRRQFLTTLSPKNRFGGFSGKKQMSTGRVGRYPGRNSASVRINQLAYSQQCTPSSRYLGLLEKYLQICF